MVRPWKVVGGGRLSVDQISSFDAVFWPLNGEIDHSQPAAIFLRHQAQDEKLSCGAAVFWMARQRRESDK